MPDRTESEHISAVEAAYEEFRRAIAEATHFLGKPERIDEAKLKYEAAVRAAALADTLDLQAASHMVLISRIIASMLVNGDSRGYGGAKDAIDEREFDDQDVEQLWAAVMALRKATRS